MLFRSAPCVHALRWPVVLFDLDGTVLDTVELIRASHEHAVREVLGLELSDEELMAGIGTPLLQQMERFSPERARSCSTPTAPGTTPTRPG